MSNLFRRVLVSAVGIPLLLFAAIHGDWALYIVILALQAGALWEWRRLCEAKDIKPNVSGMIIATIGLDVFVFSGAEWRAAAAPIVSFCIMILLDVFRRERRPMRDLSAAVFFVAYVALPLALWSLMGAPTTAMRWQPAGALAALLVTTWVCDTAAYVVGKRYGRHKLDVGASPNKTVEGFIAGVIFSALVLPVLRVLTLASPDPLDYVMLPIIVGFAGQMGDLLESLIKREVQVKDASSILPGHGGFLDRFDSLFLSSPLLFAYLVLSSA